MKKNIAMMLCLVMLLGCAAALAEYTNIGAVNVNGAFEARCVLPEGYTLETSELDNGGLVSMITSQDTAKPLLILSIMFDDMYADVNKLNDLDDEALAYLESTFTDEYDMDITYTETAYGTKLLVAKEVNGEFADVYTIYAGYEFEFVLIPTLEGGADSLTEEQIQLVIEFLSNLDFVALEDDAVPQPEGGKKFENDWAIAGGLVQVYYEEEGYRVTVNVEKEDGTGALWQYACYYMEDTDSLVSVSSSRDNYTIDPDTGDTVYTDTAYDGIDEEGKSTVFTIDAHGCLIWKDGCDDAGAGLEFANIGRFDGVWRNEEEEVEAEFLWNGADEDSLFYTVYIQRGVEGADHYALYLMDGSYDPATGKLSAEGTCTLFTKNASGEYDSQDDGELVDAFFSMLENGKLLYETANGIELEYDIMGHQ